MCANMDISIYSLTVMHVDTIIEEKIGKTQKNTAISGMMITGRNSQEFAKYLGRPV